jgi:hypothetical protein
MIKRALTLIFVISAVGCTHLVMNKDDSHRPAAEIKNLEYNTVLFGFLGLTKLPPATEICGQSRIETVEMNMDSEDVLTSIVTLGLYVPHRVSIMCGLPLTASH